MTSPAIEANPIPSAASSPAPTSPAIPKGRRREDTEIGCRANAAADLGRAGSSPPGWSRVKMEQSASAWTLRADLLGRLEAKASRRIADAKLDASNDG